MITLHTPTAVQRLMRLHDQAPEVTHRHGTVWYPKAHVLAGRITAMLGHPAHEVTIGAGILAALSPRIDWKTNQERALTLAQDPTVMPPGLKLHASRAQRIALGEHPIDVLGGPKVRAFWDNIHRPYESDAVTTDVWASRPLFPASTDPKAINDWLKRKDSYAQAEHCYRLAAANLGLRPLTLQAIVWCHVRGSHV